MSDFQAEILDDGEVAFAELERAVLAYAECAGEHGVSVEVAYRNDIRAFEYRYTGSPETFETDLAEVQEGFCQSEYKSEVELVWADQEFTQQDDEAFYAAVSDCLTARGITITDPLAQLGPASEEYPTEYDECFNTALEDIQP